ncbi:MULTISPECIES: DUF565 domain-containing protein [Prochlorococcus]|nr:MULTISPECIES: DUF565 domain-containing protein [Prochlorococcus]KGG18623.1 hypothetical protein EV08_1871 [Prochlorococcus marinus str. SS2]KGG22896.1 hypothetical protein EV09_1638 [Prochlorococcus marinus str. SS35]KGG32772.1 hypothetical protein EV10_1089 [Prochlorococcus marinus str. SS51]
MRLEVWSDNPWRRYSMLIIIFLSAFLFGSSIGMINGVLALMDPIGAFFTVTLIEVLVRFRKVNVQKKGSSISLSILDSFRMGFIYGLFTEGFKLF